MFFANGVAAVLALDAANMGELVAAVAADFVVADSIVDVREWDVAPNVTGIGAPEAGEGVGGVGGA